MPADVAVRPPSLPLPAAPAPPAAPPAAPLAWSAEELSGRLTLLGPGAHRQEVLVRVYRTSLEHFAVLHPAHRLTVGRPLGVLNLRNTRVERTQSGFTVRQRAPDAPHALSFAAAADAAGARVDEWLRAFAWREAAHASPLPALLEDDEA